MFIRRAKTRTTETGETYCAFGLVQSERNADRFRQRTLFNLGSSFPVERRHWPLLCGQCRQLFDLKGNLVVLDCERQVEQ